VIRCAADAAATAENFLSYPTKESVLVPTYSRGKNSSHGKVWNSLAILRIEFMDMRLHAKDRRLS